MEKMTDRNKAGWIIAFTIIGWMFFLLPLSGEDIPEGHPTPISHQAWVTWIVMNFVALIWVHLLISKEHRAMKRGIKTMKRVERSRRMHPTRKHG